MNISLNGMKRIFSRSKKQEKQNVLYYEQLWTTIEEMPIWNWNKVIETGDLTYLFKNRTEKTKYSNRLNGVWLDLQQQHMTEFGIDDMVMARMRYIRNIINLNIKFVQTRDRSLLNLINIEEQKLKESEGSYNVRFYKVLDAVTNAKGFRIDPKEFTVIEWYHALKNMSNGEAA